VAAATKRGTAAGQLAHTAAGSRRNGSRAARSTVSSRNEPGSYLDTRRTGQGHESTRQGGARKDQLRTGGAGAKTVDDVPPVTLTCSYGPIRSKESARAHATALVLAAGISIVTVSREGDRTQQEDGADIRQRCTQKGCRRPRRARQHGRQAIPVGHHGCNADRGTATASGHSKAQVRSRSQGGTRSITGKNKFTELPTRVEVRCHRHGKVRCRRVGM
jgi:hypothetical protein